MKKLSTEFLRHGNDALANRRAYATHSIQLHRFHERNIHGREGLVEPDFYF